MASENVETLRAAHENWNRCDFAGVVRNSAESLVYTDNARSLNLNGPDKFREWTEAWAKAFSDGRITKPEYINAGDGRMVSGGCYYDQYTLLTQLGHIQPLAEAA